MPGLYTDGAIATDPGSIFDYEAASNEVFDAGFARQFDTNPVAFIGREARFLANDFQSLAGNMGRVDQDTAQKESAALGLDLKFGAGGVTRDELEALQYLKQREIKQNTVSARSRGLVSGAAGFAGGLAASFTDPINVASGFIPIVGEVRYAQWLAAAGKGAFARGAVRAGAGALEGAVGAAIVEPIVYAGATQEQLDYGLMDSFLNVTLGGALGGGLHVIGGAVHDRVSAPSRLREIAGIAPEEVKRQAMQDAVAALERGDAVDVDHVFMKHAGDTYGVTDKEFLGRAAEFDDNEFESARSVVVMARGGEDEAQPWSFSAVLRAMGGIKVRDAEGNITREGAEVLAALGDKRAPGVINNKTGATPDYAREALMQDGWFKSDQNNEVDIQEFYDLLEADSRGERPLRHGATRGATLKTDAEKQLARAGVTKDDTVKQAAVKLAEMRAAETRARADNEGGDPDFEPSEIVYREPGEEDELAGPVTDEQQARFDPAEAYDRALIEQMDEVIATEKARPQDKIEATSADDADWRDVVEQYREQGHVTPEDDATLKQGNDLAAWAERRAKAFEAAAGCIEAA